ncbi:hypothetical protein QBC46DRAFT_25967 [Diplogelasinospora grovesii]|uniref:DUF8035 domain-containing protein n=1 Tax=Diplogelasinospora grovesii TaxID=303347 RepID=A0AAN6N0X8_9PEZI|nr:hypothetical protein QBC46DRAFT_25967 [Diplogelasinospora grovesii]
MAFRASVPDLDRSERAERWDRDRFYSEHDRDRYGNVRDRFAEEDDHVYTRGGPPPSRGPDRGPDRPYPPREQSVGDRFERRYRTYDDDDVVIRERERERLRRYDDDVRSIPPSRRRSPPPPRPSEYDRRTFVETKERERFARSPSPPRPRRPGMLRRQSSLDTFDRKPRLGGYHDREEYGPPAIRRGDYRPPANVPIPLPRHKALPPPRFSEREREREYYDEIQVSDPNRYGDDDFHAYPERAERVREKEVIRTRRRNRSRESRATTRSRRSHSVRSRSTASTSSASSSSSSSSGGTAVKSEYPKKGKTRIPARLVSKRALIDLGYPFVEEGNTIVVQKALGQENIDDLLKLSADYKKSEMEVITVRSSAGDVIEERRAEIYEYGAPPPHPHAPPGNAPVVINAHPPPPPPQPVEVVKTTYVREVSPARSSRSGYTTTTTTSATPYYVDTRGPVEVSEEIPVGPLALVQHRDHSRRRRASSQDSDSLRSEIRHLEKQLARKERHERHHSRGDIVKAERLSTGELVLFEETVEKIEEPSRGVRIEKDKKGRMSISVPKYR